MESCRLDTQGLLITRVCGSSGAPNGAPDSAMAGFFFPLGTCCVTDKSFAECRLLRHGWVVASSSEGGVGMQALGPSAGHQTSHWFP